MSDLRGRTGRSAARRRRLGAAFALAVAVALIPALASAHIERASYWPDPGPEIVDGQPTGGEVPNIRDLFTALDGNAVGETRVVCEGGEPVPYRAAQPLSQRQNQAVNRRPDQQVSRAEVDRLERKLRKKRRGKKRAKKKGHGKKVAKKKKQIRKLKRNLAAANRAHQAALAAEQAARQAGQLQYQQDLGAEQAARQAAANEQAAQRAYQEELLEQPSMQRLDAALESAVANGYVLRPSAPRVQVSQQEADRLWDFNARLLAQCAYDSIQAAVNDSGNNDRVVIMPGVYTEPDSRAQPTNDPACDHLEEVNDRGGGRSGALSFAYQEACPNDQNLIAVIGRESRHDQVPQPPAWNRRGIRDEGPCVRCNLQIEGSGISPDDVVIDTGPFDAPDHKDVAILTDRADGFVLRNVTAQGATEHAVYVLEVDGFRLERTKTNYNEEYGILGFNADHGLIQDCEARNNGDAGIYPGSAPDTGEQTDEYADDVGPGHDGNPLPPDVERLNTEIRHCDMHHNVLGYSGTDANAVHIHHNDIYDNATGLSQDVFTAAGHPGFPQDSTVIAHNEFYANNFNPYLRHCEDGEEPGPSGPDQECTDVEPTVPVPVGTGMWTPGGNANIVQGNRFWDNWGRGAMLFAVPDTFVCGPPPITDNSQKGCNPNAPPESSSTSHRNRFHDNVMGQDLDGNPDPNGTDFWWDQFNGNEDNCWFDNIGPDGTRDSLSTDPPLNPAGPPPAPHVNGFLPEACDAPNNVGTVGVQEAELLNCLVNITVEDETGTSPGTCPWFTTPSEPTWPRSIP